ncbi:hypothetical protein C8F01DRAFT_1119275, partial [Mycena amicta]
MHFQASSRRIVVELYIRRRFDRGCSIADDATVARELEGITCSGRKCPHIALSQSKRVFITDPPSALYSIDATMAQPTFPFSDEELRRIGAIGEGVPKGAAKILELMRTRADLFTPSLRVLQCVIAQSHKYDGPSSSSSVTGNSDCLELIYRSDTTSVAKPTDRSGQVAGESTPLNAVWGTVGPQIRDIVKAHGVQYSCIHAHSYTHGPPGEENCPPVVWIGVQPGFTSADTARDVSQVILALLEKNKVTGVVVEWREAVVQRL